MDNLKIVQYEAKSNFETIANVYHPFSILKTLFAVSLRCWHLFDGSATGSVVQPNIYCGELAFQLFSVCVSVQTFVFAHLELSARLGLHQQKHNSFCHLFEKLL